MTRDPQDLFQGFAPPAAPEALRRRVLDAATAQPLDPGPLSSGHRFIDRCWDNRPLRLAWAATVALLLASHGVLAGTSSPAWAPFESPPGPAASPTRVADDPELLRMLNRHPRKQDRLSPRELTRRERSASPFASSRGSRPEGGSA